MSDTDKQELTLDQELRFNVLVPFYVAMEHQRQEDAGTLTWQDGSKIYTEAIAKIAALITKEKNALLDRLLEQTEKYEYWTGTIKAVPIEAIKAERKQV
jgi:hypothetical protein